jgi:PhoD-like phosphatase
MLPLYRTALLALFVLGACIPLAAQRLHRYPVVGASSQSAAFRIWFETGGASVLRVSTDSTFAQSQHTVPATAAANDVLRLAVDNLLPATRYYYRVEDGSGMPISPVFSFKTFPEERKDAPATILFGSCQQSRESDLGKTFDMAARLDGDLFIQLGDWAYPDRLISGYPTAPGSIEESYALRLDTTYAFAKQILSRMGVAYVWDDHDFVGNNSDGDIAPSLKSEMLAAYDKYIPHYPLPNGSNGIWQSFVVGNAEFFMIDSRAQRNPVDSAFRNGPFAPPAGHSMLAGFPITGTDQRTWLLDAIRNSKARWKVLVSPVFFNPSIGPLINLALLAGRPDVGREFADKWIGYPADVDSLKRLLQQGYDRNFLIICGDAHSNVYDNGSHSLVPEFMVGNLDKENSNFYGLLKDYGFDVWTAGQPDMRMTVGRITIETSPRHRMIVESFDEEGNVVLRYEMVDSASASAPDVRGSAWKVTGASIDDSGMLRLGMRNAPRGTGTMVLYNLAGKKVLEDTIALKEEVTIPVALARGVYLGRVRIGDEMREFRVERR